MFIQKFLFASFLSVCLVQFCEAIQCYKCSSLVDPQCADDTTAMNVRKIECNGIQPPIQFSNQLGRIADSCQKVNVKDAAGSFVTRDCHFEVLGRPDTCMLSQGIMAPCAICKGDLCNSAPGRFATFGLLGLLAFVAGFMIL